MQIVPFHKRRERRRKYTFKWSYAGKGVSLSLFTESSVSRGPCEMNRMQYLLYQFVFSCPLYIVKFSFYSFFLSFLFLLFFFIPSSLFFHFFSIFSFSSLSPTKKITNILQHEKNKFHSTFWTWLYIIRKSSRFFSFFN